MEILMENGESFETDHIQEVENWLQWLVCME